ncbi:MAG TPA: glycosyltransferase family 2 protein [Candidatus Dormibacteraeota bacterium]
MARESGRPLVSALIVSYNVRELLVDCLRAFFAGSDVPVEAVVVDNASSDGSADAVSSEFPQVKVLSQARNLGYGRANNVGLAECTGRFVLLLNPDVTVGEGCVGKLADFLLVRPDVGAASPRLLRPDGSLDLACRRGFPTPATAFYRLSGLSRAFPRSKRFNRYNMGFLPDTEVHEIDAGTGACLMLRRAAVDRVGFFDPDYFMYGEDIDLCFRLKNGGWKIFYVPAATAVHLKGQSTRQSTRRMLFEFHSAMWTFHHKHYAEDMPAFANGLVWASIWSRWAVLSARSEILKDPRVSP